MDADGDPVEADWSLVRPPFAPSAESRTEADGWSFADADLTPGASYRLQAPAARAFVSFGDAAQGMSCSGWLTLDEPDGTPLPAGCTLQQ